MKPSLAISIGQPLASYLSKTWSSDVVVSDVNQIYGGASRQTYRVAMSVDGNPKNVILRRDPATSLIDTERRHEYLTYEAVFARGLPVPEPLLLEEDASVLNGAFSLMAEVPGCESAPAMLAEPPFQQHAEKIGVRFWTLLGDMAKRSPAELGVDAFMETPEHPAAHELAYWANVIRTDALHPQPIAEAAIRWLERNLPAPSTRLTLVHGDYRSGNFLYSEDGDIRAILDWEMAHIGDPLEDLAWSLDPLWGNEPHIAGNLLPRQQAADIWRGASDQPIDTEAFRWWQVFASLKGLAIWLSSAEDFHNGASKEAILALAGWVMTDRQNRILLDRISPCPTGNWAEPLL